MREPRKLLAATSERGQAIVTMIPDDRLLTEIDGPFTAEGDRPREPADVIGMLVGLALIRNMVKQGLAATLAANARKCCGSRAAITICMGGYSYQQSLDGAPDVSALAHMAAFG